MVKNNLFGLFRRKTTSIAFIPEIDGLRFLAIFLVVITHVQALYLLRGVYRVPLSWWGDYLRSLLNTAEIGVFLFFAISGFVLILPFARCHLLNKDNVSLKKYYLRRLTRLEPPYLLAMFFLFAMKIFVQKQNFTELLPHLGATLLYSHNVIYHEMSKITPITWSLEIEIQFYLLAPFLATLYRLSKHLRRTLLLIFIIALPFLQHLFGLSQYTFLGTMQYFFVGFILADLYLTGDMIKIKAGFIKPLGYILLLLLALIKPNDLWRIFFYPFLMLVFYYLVLNAEFWKKIFQNKFLTSVGGMCYSIYLLHFAVISFVGMKSFSLKSTNSYLFDILIQCVIHLPIISLICSIYYLLIEKPCMDPNWPQKIKKFTSKFYSMIISIMVTQQCLRKGQDKCQS